MYIRADWSTEVQRFNACIVNTKHGVHDGRVPESGLFFSFIVIN